MPNWSLIIVEDDSFTAHLLASELEARGLKVRQAGTAAEALRLIGEEEPHVVMSDLDLGQPVSGVDLLNRVSEDYPWIGLVALTSHADVSLAAGGSLPSQVLYLVKSEIRDLDELLGAMQDAVEGRQRAELDDVQSRRESGVPTLTAAQAEILRLMAAGLTNDEIALRRGNQTVRAVEIQVQKIFAALGLERAPGRNRRIEAVRMWEQGKVAVR